MPYFYSETEVEVTIDEFVESCKPRDIDELIQTLQEAGYLNNIAGKTGDKTALQLTFEEALLKLQNTYYQLSNEEIETIQNIAKKY
jgi:hypothetical protein